MRTYWPLFLALISTALAQGNSTVLGAQATPSPPSSTAEATEETIQAQGGGYGQKSSTCKASTIKVTETKIVTSGGYGGGYPANPVTVTVISPQTCPKPVTKTTTVTSQGGYPVNPSTVTVTKSGGYNTSPPKTVTVTSTSTKPPLTVTQVNNSTVTKVRLIFTTTSGHC
jgi:hypothetical protein